MKEKPSFRTRTFSIPRAIIGRFAKRNGVSVPTAKRLGGELVKFLTLCATSEQSLVPSPIIDEMWHHFILHTRDYEKWCTSHLGKFIHHVPSDTPDSSAYQMTRNFLKDRFGESTNKYWPEPKDGAVADCSCSDCRTASVL